jgi:septum site-determining protein MinD
MSRIIAVHSYCRGAGKSSLTANFATTLALEGRSVAVVDMDLPSPSQHVLFGLDESEIKFTLNDFLWGNCEIEQAAVDVTPRLAAHIRGSAFVVPASQRSQDIARVLRGDYYIHILHDGFERLTEALHLDVLLIDMHAGLGEESLLAFGVADTATLLLRHDQRDYQGTAVAVDVLRALDMPRIALIVNEAPSSFDFPHVKDQVAQIYKCDVIGVVPHSHAFAGMASKSIFVLRHARHPLTHKIKEIVAQLMQ